MFGVTLAGLDVDTCGESWETAFLNTSEQCINKLITLRSLSVYISKGLITQKILSKEKDHVTVIEAMKEMVDETHSQLDYVVEPIYAQVKVKMQKIGKQLRYDQPHISAQVQFERLNFNLQVSQLRNVLKTLEYITNYKKFEAHRADKPNAPLTDEFGRRQWMIYAVHQIQKELQTKYFTWTQFQEKNRKRVGM